MIQGGTGIYCFRSWPLEGGGTYENTRAQPNFSSIRALTLETSPTTEIPRVCGRQRSHSAQHLRRPSPLILIPPPRPRSAERAAGGGRLFFHKGGSAASRPELGKVKATT